MGLCGFKDKETACKNPIYYCRDWVVASRQSGSSRLCEKASWKLTPNSKKAPLWFILRTDRKHEHLLKGGEKAFIFTWLADENEQLPRCLKERLLLFKVTYRKTKGKKTLKVVCVTCSGSVQKLQFSHWISAMLLCRNPAVSVWGQRAR